MRKILLALLALAVLIGLAATALLDRSPEPSLLARLRQRVANHGRPSVDHKRFAQLQRPFARPQEVTAACIACHNGRHTEVMASSHWNWERTEYIEGKGIRTVGKKNAINNFCIGVAGSHQSCDKCHIGYGWSEETFDFQDPLNVDCLACHDNSGTYVKASGGAGYPDRAVDLVAVAQQVGRPQRANCGTCHFFGGGGNNVKHGDLEKALFDPGREVDVHMDSSGPDMSCVECHTADKHQILGKAYSISSMNRNRVECETCHTNAPHEDDLLNQHGYKLSCQACHIPRYAKVNPTKLSWDWSTAGRLRDGKPYSEEGADGTDVYMSIKGSFVWGKNLTPEYTWSNGTASHYLLGDTFDPGTTLALNELHGSYDDPDAKIIPVKIHRARQIYDRTHRYLVTPKLFSAQRGDGGFWGDFDWNRAATEGMREVGLPYSGDYGFAETEMTWPINHMVAPKNEAAACAECHTRQGGRLARLSDFYMPGRDRSRAIDGIGWTLLGLTLGGTMIHGGVRLIAHRRRGEGS